MHLLNVMEIIFHTLIICSGQQTRSILIAGMLGCGKSLLLRILSAELGGKVILIDSNADLDETLLYTKEQKCIFLVDDFDRLLQMAGSRCMPIVDRLCRFGLKIFSRSNEQRNECLFPCRLDINFGFWFSFHI